MAVRTGVVEVGGLFGEVASGGGDARSASATATATDRAVVYRADVDALYALDREAWAAWRQALRSALVRRIPAVDHAPQASA